MSLSDDELDQLRVWQEEGFRRVERRFDVTTQRYLKPTNQFRNYVIGIAATLVAGAVGYGASALLEHGTRLTAAETTQKFMQDDVTVIKGDVKAIRSSLDKLIGHEK